MALGRRRRFLDCGRFLAIWEDPQSTGLYRHRDSVSGWFYPGILRASPGQATPFYCTTGAGPGVFHARLGRGEARGHRASTAMSLPFLTNCLVGTNSEGWEERRGF